MQGGGVICRLSCNNLTKLLSCYWKINGFDWAKNKDFSCMINNSKFKSKIISNLTVAIMMKYSIVYFTCILTSKENSAISSRLSLFGRFETKHKNENENRCCWFFLNKYDEILFIYRTLNHMSINWIHI